MYAAFVRNNASHQDRISLTVDTQEGRLGVEFATTGPECRINATIDFSGMDRSDVEVGHSSGKWTERSADIFARVQEVFDLMYRMASTEILTPHTDELIVKACAGLLRQYAFKVAK
jgi:hypothetical protein